MMRLLFVAPYLPSRIRVRSYEFLRALGDLGVERTLVCPVAPHEQHALAHLRALGVTVHAVPVSTWQRAHATLNGASLGLPLQAAYGTPLALQHTLRSVVARDSFDIVHVEHLRAAALLPIVKHLPLVYDAVDCISLLLQRTAQSGPDRRSRWLARLDLGATQRFERRICERVRAVTVTSPQDAAALGVLAPTAAVHVVPNGVDLKRFALASQPRAQDTVIFTGKMNYHANVAAVQRLVEQIMPRVWQQRPHTKLWIVGADPPPAIQRLQSDQRIVVTGHVPDIASALHQATVAVSPIRYGVGIQNKVLEAMATGTPMVADRQCLEALGATSGQDLLVADDDQQFAAMILEVLHDQSIQARLGAAGRAYVQCAHRWEHNAARLVGVYQHVLHIHTSSHALMVAQPQETMP